MLSLGSALTLAALFVSAVLPAGPVVVPAGREAIAVRRVVGRVPVREEREKRGE